MQPMRSKSQTAWERPPSTQRWRRKQTIPKMANAAAQSPAPMNRIDLYNGWTVQTSRKVQATGDSISRPKFQTKGWYRTSVPMTVVAVQVAAGEFPEPYYGMNRHGGEIGRMNADAKTLRETWGLNCAACGLDLASPPGSRGAVL
jgi:hypothetical protein